MNRIIKSGTALILIAPDSENVYGTIGWLGRDFDPMYDHIALVRYVNDDGIIDFHYVYESEFLRLSKKNWIKAMLRFMSQT